ncbi:hypothetical protein HNV11_09020 [Spirosoma taeanense]|uniref:DUF3883 domain-containing protein n=1 Tax=Spirosoma taeanense TaxID=2735870 RepID=A0A6M5Y6G2_9BACT|nr:hypothetical protein [Spirosoma taeanense]QJW89509.1 hypothetical protein HNV11_09020 [Spirosoma taeanense]
MTSHVFDIQPFELHQLLALYPNLGKNSDVGKIAVKVVEKYFSSLDPNATFTFNKKGIDVTVCYLSGTECFEVKGTVDQDIAWSKLKVSSRQCYDKLVNGMGLIRVTGIGQLRMKLHFLKYGEDFKLIPEPRWSVVKIR